jgi:hypothetical protein
VKGQPFNQAQRVWKDYLQRELQQVSRNCIESEMPQKMHSELSSCLRVSKLIALIYLIFLKKALVEVTIQNV